MAPTHYGHRPRPNRSRHGATQPHVAIPPRPRYAPDAGGQDGGGGGRIPLGPGRLPEARRSEPRCRRVPRRPGVDQTPWESCCPTGASRRRLRLPAQALREGEALLSARNKLSRHRTTAIKDVEAGSQTSPGGVVSAPGVGSFGVRRLDAAFNALESGSKLPHSIAGRSRRTRANTPLPHQRDTKAGASSWYSRSGDISVYDYVGCTSASDFFAIEFG
jgi:hypothetical protein